ncbi:MAG TPA: hypothetical protein VGI47_11060, partial [Candidatus Binataceae bacterium]
MARWQDPRLAFTPSGPDDQSRGYLPASAWHPSFEFVNAVQPSNRFDSELLVKPNGLVIYTYRLAATLSNRYWLRPFPFDTQTLQMDLQPFIVNAGDLYLEAGPESAIRNEAYSGLPQWIVRGLTAEVRVVPLDRGRSTISEIRFRIRTERRYQFYVWKIFLP